MTARRTSAGRAAFTLTALIVTAAIAGPGRLEAAEGITRVNGRVVDQKGNPLAKVPLYFEATDVKKRVGPVRTSKKGTYVFSALDISVAKKWIIVPEKSGYKVVKVSFEIVDSTGEDRGRGDNLVGADQKLPELSFVPIGDTGRNVVDLVLAKDSEYVAALQAEKRKREGGTDEVEKAAADAPAAPAAPKTPPGPAPASRKALELAKSHTDAGRHDQAIPIYREYLVKDPEGLPPVYYYLGKSLFESGDDISAEQAFKKGLDLDPSMKRANFYLGRIYIRMERHPEAIAALQKERDISPESDAAHFYLGLAYAESGQDGKALESFEQAALLNPMESATFLQMATIYEKRAENAGADSAARQTNLAKAEEMYQKVVGIDPRNAAISFYNLGVKAWNDNRSKEAAQAFRKAVQIDATYAEAHRELARALMGIQDFNGAVKHFEEYLKLKPGAPDAGEIRSNIALLKG